MTSAVNFACGQSQRRPHVRGSVRRCETKDQSWWEFDYQRLDGIGPDRASAIQHNQGLSQS